MSSANEHLPPPPKPRMSPLDFRNTDLVSRLLAATPPYLYNMSLLPNTYFFSEMLRSFVQAKAEHTRGSPAAQLHPHQPQQHGRRSRKRTWSANRAECFQKQPATLKSPSLGEKPVEVPPPADWMMKNNNNGFDRKVEDNNPLELTINKIENNESGISENKIASASYHQHQQTTHKLETFAKPEVSLAEQIFPMHPSLGNSQENPTNLVLPPPPPMWYPPLYPAPPYGIDPLHFFIDLRVSGHIYDRKNHQKDLTLIPPPPVGNGSFPPQGSGDELDVKPEEPSHSRDIFKNPRHASAFSVPIPSTQKPSPMNLSPKICEKSEKNSTRFDVKSMGFDKTAADNKTSTNYIMGNIKSIYSSIVDGKNDVKSEQSDGALEETEEEREKRVKDLRALIGLELVVDYMNHAKPGQLPQHLDSGNSTDLEPAGSPALEVVDEDT